VFGKGSKKLTEGQQTDHERNAKTKMRPRNHAIRELVGPMDDKGEKVNRRRKRKPMKGLSSLPYLELFERRRSVVSTQGKQQACRSKRMKRDKCPKDSSSAVQGGESQQASTTIYKIRQVPEKQETRGELSTCDQGILFGVRGAIHTNTTKGLGRKRSSKEMIGLLEGKRLLGELTKDAYLIN